MIKVNERKQYISSLSDRDLMEEISEKKTMMQDAVYGVMSALEADAFMPSGRGLYETWDYLAALLEEQQNRIVKTLP